MSSRSLLVVEDEVLVARDVKGRLVRMGYEVIDIASNGREAIEKALRLRPDLILMDINLRDEIDGIDAAITIRETYDVPVIFCTAYSNDEVLERAKVSTPFGYVLKPFDNRELQINIEIALDKHRVEKELSACRRRLDVTLTNVSDAVIAADLSGEIYVLNPAAEIITGWNRRCIRDASLADVVMLRPFEPGTDAVDLADLDRRLGQPEVRGLRQMLQRQDGSLLPVELTLKVIESQAGDLLVMTLRDISKALTDEKALGHSAVDISQERSVTRLADKSAMEDGLADGAFEIHYQPIVDITTSELVGAEALVQWHHADHGLLPAADFIHIAEQADMILPLGEWVLRSVCQQISQWHRDGHTGFRVSVNLSAGQIDDNVSDLVATILAESGVPSESLELEIAEDIVMQGGDRTSELLAQLHGLGLNVSIDQFGTGYSSIARLKRYPVNALKIDRSLIHGIETSIDDRDIIRAIIAVGQSLQLKTQAVGVETKSQLEILRDCGCGDIQGNYCSKPLAAAELTEMLVRSRPRFGPLRAVSRKKLYPRTA